MIAIFRERGSNGHGVSGKMLQGAAAAIPTAQAVYTERSDATNPDAAAAVFEDAENITRLKAITRSVDGPRMRSLEGLDGNVWKPDQAGSRGEPPLPGFVAQNRLMPRPTKISVGRDRDSRCDFIESILSPNVDDAMKRYMNFAGAIVKQSWFPVSYEADAISIGVSDKTITRQPHYSTAGSTKP